MEASAAHGRDRPSNARLRSSLALTSSSRKISSRQGASGSTRKVEYKPVKVIGQGAFGVVYCARSADGDFVAIKKVLQDPRYRNRELESHQQIHNRYCVALRDHFISAGRKPNETFLNLIMEYLPLSLHQFTMNYRKERKYPPLLYVKLFAFQMFAGLNYLHSIGITHRDLKPQNILCDPVTGELKICDFGSAKRLLPSEKSVAYIASRYYRAPELIMGCEYYTTAIDIWAAGCVLAEMLMAGMPIFPGSSAVGQLHEIVKVLGPPTEEDLTTFQHSPDVAIEGGEALTLEKVLPRHTPPDLMALLKRIFVYKPGERPPAIDCMHDPCFDEIFEPELVMPDGRPFPVLERHQKGGEVARISE
jgi:serine/threonine protein kinase